MSDENQESAYDKRKDAALEAAKLRQRDIMENKKYKETKGLSKDLEDTLEFIETRKKIIEESKRRH
jgi:hypothetical protein